MIYFHFNKPYHMNRIFVAMLLAFTAISFQAQAQSISLRNYTISYRWFQMNAFGNNPTTVGPLMKDEAAYERQFKTITWNALAGAPGIHDLHTIYLGADWKVNRKDSRFWKKVSIQTSIEFTQRIKDAAGNVSNNSAGYSDTTKRYDYQYTLSRQRQYAGLMVGLLKRSKLGNRFNFTWGLNTQLSVCIAHIYHQEYDTVTYTQSTGWQTKVTKLPDLKAKNILQWQVYVPLGLEFLAYKDVLSVRAEFLIGFVGNRFIPHTYGSRESNGFGFSVSYWPRKKSKDL
jgi:hypothetical protein